MNLRKLLKITVTDCKYYRKKDIHTERKWIAYLSENYWSCKESCSKRHEHLMIIPGLEYLLYTIFKYFIGT